MSVTTPAGDDELTVRMEIRSDGGVELRAPRVGVWIDPPAHGELIRPGRELGRLDILGRRHRLRAPPGAYGIVVERSEGRGAARVPLVYGQGMLRLDPRAAGELSSDEGVSASASARAAAGGMVFRAPSGGRFYRRRSPEADPFVREGDDVAEGQVVGVLEIMKTFHRIAYHAAPGEGLPEHARIVTFFADDGADLAQGDPILQVTERS